jgi:CPA1 family monovalent cation:H+ antiporter
MGLFNLIAIIVSLTAVFSYINRRYIGLHPSIGVTLISLILSLMLIGLNEIGLGTGNAVRSVIGQVRFSETLLHWMLGFLLFGGSLTVDLSHLVRQRWLTISLSVLGTVISAAIVAGASWVVMRIIGVKLDGIHCMLLGALISPTDPVAVLAIIHRLGTGKQFQTLIAGESLFNDGVGVVLFITLLKFLHGSEPISIPGVSVMFIKQVAGGAFLGLLAGLAVYYLLKRETDFQTEVLLTICLTMDIVALAEYCDVSGPIAVVVAGLLIGNHGRRLDIPPDTTDILVAFWDVVEKLLNAVLFSLIGLQVLVMRFSIRQIGASLLVIPIVLGARLLSVKGAAGAAMQHRTITRGMTMILTWGGLRGGLAIAMALALPDGDQRDLIVAITYVVVAFSILVQATTIERMVRKVLPQET